jgi:hypothetical protein
MGSLKQKLRFCGDVEEVIYRDRVRLNHTYFIVNNDKITFFASIVWGIEYEIA